MLTRLSYVSDSNTIDPFDRSNTSSHFLNLIMRDLFFFLATLYFLLYKLTTSFGIGFVSFPLGLPGPRLFFSGRPGFLFVTVLQGADGLEPSPPPAAVEVRSAAAGDEK